MGFWEWLMGSPPAPEGRTAPSRPPTATTVAKRTHPLHLQVGDVVGLLATDYVIVNKVTYREDGESWIDYLLLDEATQSEWWLSAEEDDGLQLGLFQEIPLPFEGHHPPQSFTHEGVSYRQVEASEAEVTVEAEDEERSQATVRYWEYEAQSKRYATVLKWGERLEASVGKAIGRHELTVYPRA